MLCTLGLRLTFYQQQSLVNEPVHLIDFKPWIKAMIQANIPSYSLDNGKSIPAIGLGTWQCPIEEVRKVVLEALKVGYRYIDTAWLYGNEKGIGQAIADWIEAGGKRNDLFILTKLPCNANRAEDVERLLNKQLTNLGLDYVDLYLIHGPTGMKNTGNDEEMFSSDSEGYFNYDYETDLIKLWASMEDMVELGKTKMIGVSNFNKNQISRILKTCRIKPVNNQVEVHAYLRNDEIVTFCKEQGISVCAYSPLGSPARRNLYKDTDPINLLEDPVILEISERYKKTPAQVLLRHLVQRGLVVIPKSGNPKRIQENFNIFDFNLDCEDFEKVENLDRNLRFFDLSIPGLPVRKPHPEYPF